jgi:hypothetical protein
MRIACALVIVSLFITAPLLASEPGKASETAKSLSHLTSQAQKIKIGYSKEAEVIALMGQPNKVITKSKDRPGQGHIEKRNLKYGPNNNITIFIENGVATNVDIQGIQ